MKIIALEGTSGVGKTTLFHSLSEYFTGKSVRYLATQEKNYEPFKSAVENWHRFKGPSVPFTKDDIMNFAVARSDTLEFFRLLNIDVLLLDRYLYTSAVYQSNTLTPKQIMNIHQELHIPRADLALLLDADADVCFARSEARNKITQGKHLFSTSSDSIQTFRDKYLGLRPHCPEIRLLDARQSKEDVLKDAVEQLDMLK